MSQLKTPLDRLSKAVRQHRRETGQPIVVFTYARRTDEGGTVAALVEGPQTDDLERFAYSLLELIAQLRSEGADACPGCAEAEIRARAAMTALAPDDDGDHSRQVH